MNAQRYRQGRVAVALLVALTVLLVCLFGFEIPGLLEEVSSGISIPGPVSDKLGKRALFTNKGKVKDEDAAWRTCVNKGKELIVGLSDPSKAKQSILDNDATLAESIAKPFEGPLAEVAGSRWLAPLGKWGWVKGELGGCSDQVVADKIRAGSGMILGDLRHGVNVQWDHKKQVVVSGLTYKPTEAVIGQVFHVNAGVVVTRQNYGPEHRHAPKPWPQLMRWSDIFFLTWMYLTEGKPEQRKSLKWIQREVLQNPVSLKIIEKIAERLGTERGCYEVRSGGFRPQSQWRVPILPGIKLEGGEEFEAILGSPNGYGPAYLLSQHPKELGERTIKSITIYNCLGGTGGQQYQPSLLIEIGSKAGASQKGVP